MVQWWNWLLFSVFSCSPHSVIKKERQPPSPDDVIVLSDNEPSSPLMNGHSFTKTDTDKLMVGKQHLNLADNTVLLLFSQHFWSGEDWHNFTFYMYIY